MTLRYILIAFTLCSSVFSFGQFRSGEVIYKVERNPKDYFKPSDMPLDIKNVIEEIYGEISDLEFELKFNSQSSLFQAKSKSNIDTSSYHYKLALLFTRSDSEFFAKIGDSFISEQTSFLGESYLVEIPFLEWTITKEQKMIGKYMCYKALAPRKDSGPDGLNTISIYTAWYCPDLPYPFGPYEVMGLPGLVLEFSNDKLIYTATEIKFREQDLILVKPSNGRRVTREELHGIGKEAFQNKH